MKYDYYSFYKDSRGKWNIALREGLNIVNMAKPKAMAKLIKRHTSFYQNRGNGNIGLESVTKLLPGGTRKDTEHFDYFFEYTLIWGGFRTRYREGVCRAGAKR